MSSSHRPRVLIRVPTIPPLSHWLQRIEHGASLALFLALLAATSVGAQDGNVFDDLDAAVGVKRDGRPLAGPTLVCSVPAPVLQGHEMIDEYLPNKAPKGANSAGCSAETYPARRVAEGDIPSKDLQDRPRDAERLAKRLVPAKSSILREMAGSSDLEPRIQIIDEASFQNLLESSSHDGVGSSTRQTAAELVAALSDPRALGVYGEFEKGPLNVEGDVFIVLRDAAFGPDRKVEGRDLYVAAVSLSGMVAWRGNRPRVGWLEGFPSGQCSDVYRGCRPLHGSPGGISLQTYASPQEKLAGLAASTTLNLEGPAAPPNASNRFPKLQIYTRSSARPNEFQCRSPVSWSECTEEPVAGQRYVNGHLQPFPDGTVLIGERDFLNALKANGFETPKEEMRRTAVKFGTAANLDEAIGVQGAFEGGSSFEARLFVVVRNPLLEDSIVEARHFYIVPINLSGKASWLARNPFMVFDRELPQFEKLNLNGPCGQISVPEDTPPVCDRPPCLPGDIEVERGGGSYGSDRWPTEGRTTVRIPVSGELRYDLFTLACTMFQPPPPRSPCGGGPVPVGVTFYEQCNGLDDDCDGDVDEGDVCANRQVCGMCQAKTCAQQGIWCGTATDGCGTPLNCGVCP